MLFYSIIASLKNELGHFYEYNLAFSKAAKINNFKHVKIIPKTAQIPSDDGSWQKLIYEINNEKKWKNIKNFFPFIRVLKKIKKEKKPIIFLEDFNLVILTLLLISSAIVRPKAQLWLFHRFEYETYFLNGKFCKVFHFLFEKIFGNKNIRYLTDSELIQNVNSKYFRRTFCVFPIPHTTFF